MTHRLVLASASVVAMSVLAPVAHATSLDEVCNQSEPITEDTKVTTGGGFSGDCTIEVNDARLEIRGVTIVIKGELRINDVTPEDQGAAELVIKYAKIRTDARLRIEGPWDWGVFVKYNYVYTGDDLRVRPVGFGPLVVENNIGLVVDDMRFGDADMNGGLNGDMDIRNNRITMEQEVPEDGSVPSPTEFFAASFNGDINVRNNRIKKIREVEITSMGGGDVVIRNNKFEAVTAVDIESTGGTCESRDNSPASVNDMNNDNVGLACTQ